MAKVCKQCNRLLRSQESIDRGYGPSCYKVVTGHSVSSSKPRGAAAKKSPVTVQSGEDAERFVLRGGSSDSVADREEALIESALGNQYMSYRQIHRADIVFMVTPDSIRYQGERDDEDHIAVIAYDEPLLYQALRGGFAEIGRLRGVTSDKPVSELSGGAA